MNKDVLDVIQTMDDFWDVDDIYVLSHKIESLMIQKGLYVSLGDIIFTIMELKNLKRMEQVPKLEENVKQKEHIGFFEKVKDWIFMNLTPYGRSFKNDEV